MQTALLYFKILFKEIKKLNINSFTVIEILPDFKPLSF